MTMFSKKSYVSVVKVFMIVFALSPASIHIKERCKAALSAESSQYLVTTHATTVYRICKCQITSYFNNDGNESMNAWNNGCVYSYSLPYHSTIELLIKVQ